MAVAYRQGEAYLPLAEAVFIEAGIPVYLHEGSPLAERPVGRQTLGLLALFDSDLSRQSVMDFLTDARLPAEVHDEYGSISASRWDAVSRRAGIVVGAEQWGARLAAFSAEQLLEGEDGEAPPDWASKRAEDAASLGRFIADLNAQMSAAPQPASWATQLDYLQGLLSRYVAGAGEVVKALRGLERFTALEAEVDFGRFLEVVRRAVGTLRSEDVLDGTGGAFAHRGVNIVAVNSLVEIEFACVWILGATERTFPPPARQDPILLDEERARISGRAPAPLLSRAQRGSEEALVFALACEAAGECLVVSNARRATGESRPRLPSVFFRELAAPLLGQRVSAEDAPLLQRSDVERIAGDVIGAPISTGHVSDRLAVAVAAANATSAPEHDRTYLQARVTRPLAVATYKQAAPAFARALEFAQARFADRYSVWDGALGPAAAAAIKTLMPAGKPMSATALESYAACPHRFMLSRLLQVKGVEEPERVVQLTPLFRGNVIHRIFERFSRTSGREKARPRWRRRRPAGCARSPNRSATRPGIAVRPAMPRCGRPIASS